MNTAHNQSHERVRTTRGCCHTCLAEVHAEVVIEDGAVFLDKHCPTHGLSRQPLSDDPDYWVDLDRFYFKVNPNEYPQRDFIVRMTERCNLSCPICLARANTDDTPDLDLDGLRPLIEGRRGLKIDLMAAEPTLREDLEEWVKRVKAAGHIASLHTNGLKLANRAYAERIAAAGVDEVYLQFDGFDDAANKVLRGRPLLKARTAALKNLRELQIGTSLIVVVARGLNEDQVGETLRFAARPENDHIREVFFMGLRKMGAARDDDTLSAMSMMPDELIADLCEQEPAIQRADVRAFNKLYFALLSLFEVRKCLYIQHYLVARDGAGGYKPISDLVNLPALERAVERFAEERTDKPLRARFHLFTAMARAGLQRQTLEILDDLIRMQNLLRTGMRLDKVPRRFLMLGFITACDPQNYDTAVAQNCGKGELSADQGFRASSADANVQREQRWARERGGED